MICKSIKKTSPEKLLYYIVYYILHYKKNYKAYIYTYSTSYYGKLKCT